MDAYFEQTDEGWFYQLEDGPKQGPFATRDDADKALTDAIAESLAAYAEEVLIGT